MNRRQIEVFIKTANVAIAGGTLSLTNGDVTFIQSDKLYWDREAGGHRDSVTLDVAVASGLLPVPPCKSNSTLLCLLDLKSFTHGPANVEAELRFKVENETQEQVLVVRFQIDFSVPWELRTISHALPKAEPLEQIIIKRTEGAGPTTILESWVESANGHISDKRQHGLVFGGDCALIRLGTVPGTRI